MLVNYESAQQHLIACIKAGIVALLEGPPAVGKSELAQGLAKYFNLYLIDIRLAQVEPVDLLGFPSISPDKKTASYIPMDIWPLEHTPIPKGYKGFLLFFDEFTSTSRAVQSASYRVILDRMIGGYKLHPKTAIICAGNRMEDNAIVNRMSTAMQSRLAHFELTVDHGLWMTWAIQNNIDYRILAYLEARPDHLFKFDPDHSDKTFASPRTWVFASKLLKTLSKNKLDTFRDLPLMASVIGEPVAREFVLTTQILDELPSFDKIQAAATTIEIPAQPGILYAIVYILVAKITLQNMSNSMKYISRLPIEFATITLQNLLKKHSEQKHLFLQNPELQKWITEKGAEFF